MRISYDNGVGGMTGRWFSLHFGPGAGYMRSWWVRLNRGPGHATTPGVPCGHRGVKHCRSIYCSRWWCRLPGRSPVIRFLAQGHTFRVWLGCPSGHHRSMFRQLMLSKRTFMGDRTLYAPVSFR